MSTTVADMIVKALETRDYAAVDAKAQPPKR